jgi:FKBP-type peptidyl-prolyl cis-trans isomerase 2
VKGVKTSRGAVFLISVLLLGSVLLGSGCTDKGNKGEVVESKVVKAGDTVQVDYTGKLENGTVFDTSKEDVAKQAGIYVKENTYAPLKFVVGSGRMIKGFDKSIIGMKIGEEKTIKCPPEEAYGIYDKNLTLEVPIQELNLTKPPEIGQTFWNQYGNKFKVIAANDTYVTLDANHELAGKTLIFDIKLVSIE